MAAEALASVRLEVEHMGDEESVLDDLAILQCAIRETAATPERDALSGNLLKVQKALRNGDGIEAVGVDFVALTKLVMPAPAILRDVTNTSSSPYKGLNRSTGPVAQTDEGTHLWNDVDDFDAFLAEVRTLSISESTEETAAPGKRCVAEHRRFAKSHALVFWCVHTLSGSHLPPLNKA
jgi:hypothetical protein